MSTTPIPYLKWGEYKSKSENKPDTIQVKITETDTFETEYSRCIVAIVDGNETIIPLHSFESANKQLLKLWLKAKKDGKLPKDALFSILTWLGKSKKNKDRPIRRFKFKF